MDDLEVFVGGRGVGKTHALIAWASDDPNNRYIVEPDAFRAQDLARLHGPNIQFVSYDSIAQGLHRGRSDALLGFDNAEELLARKLGVRPSIITVNGRLISPSLEKIARLL